MTSINPLIPFGAIVGLFVGLAVWLTYLELRSPPVYVTEPERTGGGVIALGLAIILAAIAVTLFLPV